MGLFGGKIPGGGGQSVDDLMKQAQAMQAQATAQMAAVQQVSSDSTAAVGSMTWGRQVMNLIAPVEPGYVKRCACVTCGAPKKLPSVTAYVYCDYCASLIDYDLRRAGESDVPTDPQYPATVNGAQPQLQAAQASGDQGTYLAVQRQIYHAYVTFVPSAVSHRAKNDALYRDQLVEYMAQAATVAAFDPTALQLTDEMRQRAIGLRYAGAALTPTVEPDSFWPMVGTLQKQISYTGELNKSAGVSDLDPDHAADYLGPKFAWSMFCQGWLSMLPEDAASTLLDQAGLKNTYVAIDATGGTERSCGGCGGHFTSLPGATVMVCEDCGRQLDVGAAEIPCTNCGATITFPVSAGSTACPYCDVTLDKVGIR